MIGEMVVEEWLMVRGRRDDGGTEGWWGMGDGEIEG